MLFALVLAGAACSSAPKPTPLESTEGTLNELSAAIQREIKDPDKAAQLTGLADQLKQIMIEASEDSKAHAATIRSLNADYDATEKEFQAAFREFNARRLGREERILAINQRAKALTTAQEWKELDKIGARYIGAEDRM